MDPLAVVRLQNSKQTPLKRRAVEDATPTNNEKTQNLTDSKFTKYTSKC